MTPGSRIPTLPTNTTIHGISGTIETSMQTIVGYSPILIFPDMTDHVLSQGWLVKYKSVTTTFNSIYNTHHITLGNTTFHIEMEKDSLYLILRKSEQLSNFLEQMS